MAHENVLERWAESAYALAPAILQHWMVSAKGLLFKRQRYGSAYRKELAFLRQCQGMDTAALQAVSDERLHAFLAYVAEKSPWYRRQLAGQLPVRLADWPILRKSELRAHTAEIAVPGARIASWSSTSGTTGTPLVVGYTRDDLQRRFAALTRQFDAMGVDPFEPHARFSGRTIIRASGRLTAVSRENRFLHEHIYSTYHLSEANASLYLAALRKQRPVWAVGYPSAFLALSRILPSEDLQALKLRAITVTAETLSAPDRQIIESAFGTRVFNQYASSEGAPFITECRNGALHCNPETGFFEFEPVSDAPDNHLYRLLVTSYNTHAFPLVRYDVGDLVEWTPGRTCTCGYAGKIIDAIHGRSDDFIHSPDRGWVGRLDPVFKSCPASLLETQIVQVAPDALEIRYVPDKERFNDADLDPVRIELQRRVGDMQLHFIATPHIPRSANGKFRAVVGLPKR